MAAVNLMSLFWVVLFVESFVANSRCLADPYEESPGMEDERREVKELTNENADVDNFENMQVRNLPPRYFSSCRAILEQYKNAPSKEYRIQARPGKVAHKVYCEMGLNGGGYTFLHPSELYRLSNSELQAMFRDRSSFLMRYRKSDGTQPYAVLRQLSRYSDVQLKLGLNNYNEYARPVNANNQQYLYYGFLPVSRAKTKSVQGLKVNDIETTFTNCDANPNSYFALFPNFREIAPSSYAYGHRFDPFSSHLFGRHKRNPSGRVIPEDYFMFLETHWGGCGTYTQTDGRPSAAGILGANIGFR